MKLSKIKVIKKLGAGMLGTVYLIEYENKIYAMKIQKILEEEKTKNIKFPIWREALFYNDVNKMPPESQKFFCKLYGYKIIENCKHDQIRPKVFPHKISFFDKSEVIFSLFFSSLRIKSRLSFEIGSKLADSSFESSIAFSHESLKTPSLSVKEYSS